MKAVFDRFLLCFCTITFHIFFKLHHFLKKKPLKMLSHCGILHLSFRKFPEAFGRSKGRRSLLFDSSLASALPWFSAGQGKAEGYALLLMERDRTFSPASKSASCLLSA